MSKSYREEILNTSMLPNERDMTAPVQQLSPSDFESNPFDGGRPGVAHVFGSAKNFTRYGLPSEAGEQKIAYYFHPTWRSQLVNLFWYGVTCIVAVVGSNWDSLEKFVVLPGNLFPVGSTMLVMHLPLLALLPGFVLGKILFNAYNARYIIDESGVEAQVGLVSLYLRQPRLRFDDIRGVEPEQSLVERILGIGRVLIGSAMTAEVEIVMEGVADPRAIQILINKERDRRMKLLQGNGMMQRAALINGE